MTVRLPLLLVALLSLAAAPAPVRVAAKVFTESAILDQIAVQRLTADGVPAVTGPPLSGTDTLFKALLADQVDVYPEYTGTIAQQILHDPALTTDVALRAALAKQGVGMTDSLGFDDTYAIGVTAARAAARHLTTIGDLARHPDLRLGFSTEFARRPDGWPGVRAAYGLPDFPVQALDHELAYRALLDGSIDATDLYSTDAEIPQYHLRVLSDDRHFFPAYRAVYLYRLPLPAAAVASLDKLQGQIDAAQMQAMNAAAKVGHRPEAAVAADFLHRSAGVVPTAAEAGPSLWRELWLFTRQHLTLVAISLTAAVLVAVPLGVVAAEFPAVGHVVLIVVSAIYTIPALALLVFMIPLLGIGPEPAIVALFLYSLLPIVRNTQAGLRAVPASLRESAQVLGLSRWARLIRIEVPMASPSILAGIKTSAVLNVGTATLGGLIGAGGYGQPILDGIRLEDTHRLLLLGAIPAALMALAFQGGFDLLEPLVVPRGLRLRPAAD